MFLRRQEPVVHLGTIFHTPENHWGDLSERFCKKYNLFQWIWNTLDESKADKVLGFERSDLWIVAVVCVSKVEDGCNVRL